MGSLPFAFSVHQIVSSVGADVGFAAIVGLAILVLLYFAQARETANLREQTYAAGQRVEQLEARLAVLTRRQAAAPAPSASPIAVSRMSPAAAGVGPAARTAPPAAPAGVGAPALAAATRLIPSTVFAEPRIEEVSPSAPAIEADPGATANGGAGATLDPRPGGAVPYAPAGSDREQPQSAAVPPATFAGAGNGAARDYAGSGATRDYPGSGAARDYPGRAVPGSSRQAERPPARQIAPIPPRRPARPPQEPPPRSPLRVVGALLLGAVVAAVVVVAILHFTARGASTAPASHRSAAATHTRKHGSLLGPSSVTVAVLNGTSITGLASRTATRLKALGYKQGTVADAAAQTYTASVVQYMPGDRADALAVANVLKLKHSAVQPIDSTTQTVACPQSPCTAKVVVTAGADLASQ